MTTQSILSIKIDSENYNLTNTTAVGQKLLQLAGMRTIDNFNTITDEMNMIRNHYDAIKQEYYSTIEKKIDFNSEEEKEIYENFYKNFNI